MMQHKINHTRRDFAYQLLHMKDNRDDRPKIRLHEVAKVIEAHKEDVKKARADNCT